MKSSIRHWIVKYALLLMSVAPGGALAMEFDQIVTFGGSLSDSGNFFALTGTAINAPYDEVDPLYIPPAPYNKGGNHFSNGATWVEQLAEQLGLQESAEPAFGDSNGTAANYAVGGARAREDGVNINLQTQVTAFLEDVSFVAPANALYVIDMGANDVRDALAAQSEAEIELIFGDALQAIGSQLGRLYAAGARKFLILNVPNLGVLPSTQILDAYYFPGAVFFASLLTNHFNDNLDDVVAYFSALPGVEIARLDIYSKVNKAITGPNAFGLTQVSAPCITPNIAPFSCKNPNEFLFWDGIHPTKSGHQILATEAAATLAQ